MTVASEALLYSSDVRLWHKADSDADDEHVRFSGVKRTSLIPLTNVR